MYTIAPTSTYSNAPGPDGPVEPTHHRDFVSRVVSRPGMITSEMLPACRVTHPETNPSQERRSRLPAELACCADRIAQI